MTPEGRVKRDIKKRLDAEQIWYCMPVTMGYGRSGLPDFIICLRGLLVAVECKAAGGKQTTLQKLVQKAIEANGGIYLVIDEHNLEKDLFYLL